MNDTSISVAKMVTILLWMAAGLLLAASWLTMAAGGRWHVAALLGVTATIVAIVAAVGHCRWYLLRLSALIRGCTEDLGGGVRPLR